MRMSLKPPMLLVVVSLCAVVGTPGAQAVESCPNEQLRAENNSLELPDCRAYELVSPDSNHGAIALNIGGTTPDGDMFAYQSKDAPDEAQSSQGLFNDIRASRSPSHGWAGVSLSPPLPAPVTVYTSFETLGLSADLLTTVQASDQPLSEGPVPPGKNIYVGLPNGAYRLVTTVGGAYQPITHGYLQMNVAGGTPDFSHIYIVASSPQHPSDPQIEDNVYEWSEAGGLHLIGILPDGTPAPEGAHFLGVSDDGRYVAFNAEGGLYLRADATQTVKVGEIAPDSGNPGISDQALVTAAGTNLVFTTETPETTDANPVGKDLYSYDIATGHLNDLVVDTNPGDAGTGANVQHVYGAAPDGSYIWFTATGVLAGGAAAGQTSLYVWHDGNIEFVARATGMARAGAGYMTPNGQHLVFASTDSLTGYDNTDPTTGQPHSEVFEATADSGVVCVSCRVDGARPTDDSNLPLGTVASADGARVYFNSDDAIVPRAASGVQQVYEYESGKVAAISPPDGSEATFLDASPSGDDVFFDTYDTLVPNPNGGDSAVYDARVAGGFPVSSRQECSSVACRGPESPPPLLDAPSSASFFGPAASLVSPAPTTIARSKPLTRAQKLAKALKACRGKHNKKSRAACEKRARRTYRRSK